MLSQFSKWPWTLVLIPKLPLAEEESKSAVPCAEVQQRTRSSREVSLVVWCSTLHTRSLSSPRESALWSRINPRKRERMRRNPELDCRCWRRTGSCCRVIYCRLKQWRGGGHRGGRRHGRKGRTIRGGRGGGGPLLLRSTLVSELRGTINSLSTVTTTRSWRRFVMKLVGLLKKMAPPIARFCAPSLPFLFDFSYFFAFWARWSWSLLQICVSCCRSRSFFSTCAFLFIFEFVVWLSLWLCAFILLDLDIWETENIRINYFDEMSKWLRPKRESSVIVSSFRSRIPKQLICLNLRGSVICSST